MKKESLFQKAGRNVQFLLISHSRSFQYAKENFMGHLCEAGEKNVQDRGLGWGGDPRIVDLKRFLKGNPNLRIGLILGTGWSNPDVLKAEGFVLKFEIPFDRLGLHVTSGSGHPNKFLFGTWHDKCIVISSGRIHLFQDREKFGHESLIRRWMSLLIYFMNGSKQLVITSAVGGLSRHVHEDMLVMPSGIISAHLPMPYLIGSEGEFVMSDHLLWQNNSRRRDERNPHIFRNAVHEIECQGETDVTHYVVPGPGFGGATERRLWQSWGCDTVGMSLDPELRLVALENQDNRPFGARGEYHETDIRVFPTLYVSDAHDMPNNDEIQVRAKAMAPKFGKFLSEVVKAVW